MKDYMGELERERYCMFLVALKIAGELLESSLFINAKIIMYRVANMSMYNRR